MSTLTTKLTIMLATTVTVLGAATPALADDGAAVAPTPQQTLADAIHWGGKVAAALAGIVLLAKLLQSYRRSQWRRHWLTRSTVLYVGSPQLGWPSGSISGRATSRSASLGMTAPMTGTGVARSATRL